MNLRITMVFPQPRRNVASGIGKELVIDKANGDGCAFHVQRDDSQCHVRLSRNVFGTKTDRLVFFFEAAMGVMGGPAFLILEKSYRGNLPCAAQIEPVVSATRHSDHIPRPNLN